MKDLQIPLIILSIGLSIAAIAMAIGYGINTYNLNMMKNGYEEVTIQGCSYTVLNKVKQ